MIASFVSKHRQPAVFLLLVLCSLVMLLAASEVSVGFPKAAGQNVAAFFMGAVSGTRRWVQGTFNSIGELREAREELQVLRAQLQEAERISRDIARLRRENAQLRELLDLNREFDMQNIPAEIVGKQPGNAAELLILNKGARHGIRRFMPVVAQQQGVTGLVGKVVTVGGESATVLPLSGETSYVAVRLESSRYDGLLAGQGPDTPLLLMRNVSKLGVREISYGDMVITSGLGCPN